MQTMLAHWSFRRQTIQPRIKVNEITMCTTFSFKVSRKIFARKASDANGVKKSRRVGSHEASGCFLKSRSAKSHKSVHLSRLFAYTILTLKADSLLIWMHDESWTLNEKRQVLRTSAGHKAAPIFTRWFPQTAIQFSTKSYLTINMINSIDTVTQPNVKWLRFPSKLGRKIPPSDCHPNLVSVTSLLRYKSTKNHILTFWRKSILKWKLFKNLNNNKVQWINVVLFEKDLHI